MSQLRVSHDDLAVVLDLAILTGDRDRAEQRALERVAAALDAHRNLMVTGGQNSRVERPVRTVRCTFSDHHAGSIREAQRLGVEACRCYGDRVVPAFTELAHGERLVDAGGWSRARDAVREPVE